MIMQRAWCHSEPVCLVGIFWLLPHVCTTRERNGRGVCVHVERENKVCGRNYPRLWQGLLSTPICESGLRSPAKHNISSILSQWQANIIEQRLFFPNAWLYCWLHRIRPDQQSDWNRWDWKRETEWGRKDRIVVDVECHRKKWKEKRRRKKKKCTLPVLDKRILIILYSS